MGWLDGDSCYASKPDALAAFAARQTGGIVQADGAAYIVTLAPVGDGLSVRYLFRPVASGSSFTRVIQPLLQPCDLLEWPDYIVLSWSVVAVWVSVYALRVVRRALNV